MALRAMPRLHVVRPSDANETLDLVERCLRDPQPGAHRAGAHAPGRPGARRRRRRASAAGAWRGGYVVRERRRRALHPRGHRLGGRPLPRAPQTSSRERGVATRVVALPCWRCFDAQDAAYRDAVLAPRRPRSRSRRARRSAGSATSTTRWAWTASACRRRGPSPSSTSGIGPAALVAHVERALGRARDDAAPTLYERAARARGSTTSAATGSTTGRWPAWSTTGVRGVTSNPSIFAKALATSSSVRRRRSPRTPGSDPEALFEALAVGRRARRLRRPGGGPRARRRTSGAPARAATATASSPWRSRPAWPTTPRPPWRRRCASPPSRRPAEPDDQDPRDARGAARDHRGAG